MGRKKIDRSDKKMYSFELNIFLLSRLRATAKEKNITVSELIRNILEKFFEERDII